MSFIAIPNTAEVDIRCTQDDQHVENTLYFHSDSTWDSDTLLALATEVSEWFVANYLPLVGANLTLQSVFAKSLDSSGAPYVEYFGDNGEVGAAGGITIPTSVTWVLKFLTGLSGRSYRGRNYIMGLTTAIVDGDYVLGTFAAAMIAAYNLLLPPDFSSGRWVVASRYHDHAPRGTGVATSVTAVGYSDLVADSRRRRLPGRGS